MKLIDWFIIELIWLMNLNFNNVINEEWTVYKYLFDEFNTNLKFVKQLTTLWISASNKLHTWTAKWICARLMQVIID